MFVKSNTMKKFLLLICLITILCSCAIFHKGDKPKFDQNQKFVTTENQRVRK